MTPPDLSPINVIPQETTGALVAIVVGALTSLVTLIFTLYQRLRDNETSNRIKLMQEEGKLRDEKIDIVAKHAENASQHAMTAKAAAKAAEQAVKTSRVERKEQYATISTKMDETKEAVETVKREVVNGNENEHRNASKSDAQH